MVGLFKMLILLIALDDFRGKFDYDLVLPGLLEICYGTKLSRFEAGRVTVGNEVMTGMNAQANYTIYQI